MYVRGPRACRPPGPLSSSAVGEGKPSEGAIRARNRAVLYGDVRPNLSSVYTKVKRKVPDSHSPFAAWRTVVLHDQEVLQARLVAGLSADDPDVRAWLERWPGRRYVQSGPDGVEVTLARRARPRPRERWWLHAVLLLLTLAAATVAGAILADGDPLAVRGAGDYAIPVPTRLSAAGIGAGLWFSLPLLAILGAHEMGHYVLARRHGMDASPPYFIPAPWFVNLIGTFGAFIRLRSPLLNRAVLLDMGAAGPIVGFLVAVPVTMAGLALSTASPQPPGAGGVGMALMTETGWLPLGEPLVMRALVWLSPLRHAPLIDLHPLAFAGWLGFFFTALNLFPVGQLDGGHVTFALSGRAHRVAGVATLALLLAMGIRWPGWLFWGVLILLLGRGRVAHPPVFDPAFRLNGPRRAVAYACILIFFLTLSPVPFPL